MSIARMMLAQATQRSMSMARRVGGQIGLIEPPPPALPFGAAPPRHVFRWDLDKTYLRTEFDSFRDLVKSAIETAADKKAFPGAPALLRSLQQEGHRICIVSGSPTQMRQVLGAKLALDGIAHDEFILKNNLRNILRGRFRSLRSQIPYKLPAMLQSRIGATAPAETLFGDDAEADAIIYCLYADVVAGVVSMEELERVLAAARTYDDDAARIMDLAQRVPKAPAVHRMFIHLDRKSPPMGFRKFGRRLVPVFNYFQSALVLFSDGVLTARQVLFVALEMLDSKQYELGTLATSMQDLMRRGRLTIETADRLVTEVESASASGALAGRADLPALERIIEEFKMRIRSLAGTPPLPFEDVTLDYVRLVDEEHAQRKERRKRGQH
jgi:hypothetical protein